MNYVCMCWLILILVFVVIHIFFFSLKLTRQPSDTVTMATAAATKTTMPTKILLQAHRTKRELGCCTYFSRAHSWRLKAISCLQMAKNPNYLFIEFILLSRKNASKQNVTIIGCFFFVAIFLYLSALFCSLKRQQKDVNCFLMEQ